MYYGKHQAWWRQTIGTCSQFYRSTQEQGESLHGSSRFLAILSIFFLSFPVFPPFCQIFCLFFFLISPNFYHFFLIFSHFFYFFLIFPYLHPLETLCPLPHLPMNIQLPLGNPIQYSCTYLPNPNASKSLSSYSNGERTLPTRARRNVEFPEKLNWRKPNFPQFATCFSIQKGKISTTNNKISI